MTSVFVLSFCLTSRILFGYLIKTFKFFGPILQVMKATQFVLSVLSVAAAVWVLAMLIWILVKTFTGIKGLENPVVDKVIGKKFGKTKRPEKNEADMLDYYGYDWNDYYGGG